MNNAKLTPRQLPVCQLTFLEGLTAFQIGRRFIISPRTVEGHLQAAYALGKKLGAKVEYKELPRTEGYNPQQDANGEWRAINAGEGPGSVGPFETRAALDNWLGTIKQPKATRVLVPRLTPKLKAAATGKGFPLFSNAHPGLMFTPVERDKDFLRAYQKGNAT